MGTTQGDFVSDPSCLLNSTALSPMHQVEGRLVFGLYGACARAAGDFVSERSAQFHRPIAHAPGDLNFCERSQLSAQFHRPTAHAPGGGKAGVWTLLRLWWREGWCLDSTALAPMQQVILRASP